MLDFDSPRWSELSHAYGPASNIPALLKELESFPIDDANEGAWASLWSALAHQGDVHGASFAAVPHVVAIAAREPTRASASYFHFPAWVEICRVRDKISVPADLESAYVAAIQGLAIVARERLAASTDEAILRCIFCAIAASQGKTVLAQAILELEQDLLEEFMEWLIER